MKTQTDYYRFSRDFYPLVAMTLLWGTLAFLAGPAWPAFLIAFIILAVLTFLKGPSLVRDYKRRGFIFAEYFWEENYIKKILKFNEKKAPKAHLLYLFLAVILAAWLLMAPILPEKVFDESLRVGVLFLAILFLETALVCFFLKKKIYRSKDI